MLYWECKRRRELLRQFRVLAFDYFENIQLAGWMSRGTPPIMNEKAQKARHEMNNIMEDAVLSFNLLRVPHHVVYGEYAQKVDIIGNIFALYQFQIDSQVAFDSIDRAIGAYENECQRLLRMSLNPFYWLGMLIVWFLRLPFKLLGAAGFDATKAENSLPGKVIKLVMGLATFTAAIVKIADDWDMIRRFLEKCGATLHRL